MHTKSDKHGNKRIACNPTHGQILFYRRDKHLLLRPQLGLQVAHNPDTKNLEGLGVGYGGSNHFSFLSVGY